MNAQTSLEILLLFGIFLMIILSALWSMFEIKQEIDFRSQHTFIFNNLIKLTSTLERVRLSCPAKEPLVLNFIRPVMLETIPSGKGSWIIVNSSGNEILFYYNAPVYSVNKYGTHIMLDISCSSGVVDIK